jgi:excisionase family DNA binding protein
MTKRNTSVPFEQRLTCTVREAIDYTGFGETKIYEMIGDGRLQSKKIDGKRLIHVKSILVVLGISADSDAAPSAAS